MHLIWETPWETWPSKGPAQLSLEVFVKTFWWREFTARPFITLFLTHLKCTFHMAAHARLFDGRFVCHNFIKGRELHFHAAVGAFVFLYLGGGSGGHGGGGAGGEKCGQLGVDSTVLILHLYTRFLKIYSIQGFGSGSGVFACFRSGSGF